MCFLSYQTQATPTGSRRSCSRWQVCADPPCPASGQALLTVSRAEDDKVLAHPKDFQSQRWSLGQHSSWRVTTGARRGAGRAEGRPEEETLASFLVVQVQLPPGNAEVTWEDWVDGRKREPGQSNRDAARAS